jgi:hypothetical protein
MICTYEYKDGILFQIFPEAMTDHDMNPLAKEMDGVDNEYSILPNRLVNLQALNSFDGNFDSVLKLAQMRVAKKFPNRFKSALVVANDLQLGFARMFQTLSDNPQVTLEVFRDESTAIEWLKTDNT